MAKASYQTVRLCAGMHKSPEQGVCAMELASMLAGERFGDRPRSVSPVIGAFLRTYNDGIGDHARQDLYAYAAKVVGTRARRSVEGRRVTMCLDLARRHYARLGANPRLSGRASIALASAEAAGTWAARSLLRPAGDDALHLEALHFLDELIDAGLPAARRHGTVGGVPLSTPQRTGISV